MHAGADLNLHARHLSQGPDSTNRCAVMGATTDDTYTNAVMSCKGCPLGMESECASDEMCIAFPVPEAQCITPSGAPGEATPFSQGALSCASSRSLTRGHLSAKSVPRTVCSQIAIHKRRHVCERLQPRRRRYQDNLQRPRRTQLRIALLPLPLLLGCRLAWRLQARRCRRCAFGTQLCTIARLYKRAKREHARSGSGSKWSAVHVQAGCGTACCCYGVGNAHRLAIALMKGPAAIR